MTTTPDTLAKLAACPFCGSAAEICTLQGEDGDAGIGAQYVCCTNSSCSSSSALVYPLMDDVTTLLAERWNRRALTAQALPAAPEPVAWRVRGYNQFKTGTPGPWRYFDGPTKPGVNTPDCCDIEPLTTPQAAQQAAQAPAGWVSVADRLPPPFENVVVHPRPTEYCCEAQVNTQGAWQYHEYEHNFGVNHFKCEVTHWWSSPPPAALPQPQSAQAKGDAA